jgi:hypothetical protein
MLIGLCHPLLQNPATIDQLEKLIPADAAHMG